MGQIQHAQELDAPVISDSMITNTACTASNSQRYFEVNFIEVHQPSARCLLNTTPQAEAPPSCSAQSTFSLSGL